MPAKLEKTRTLVTVEADAASGIVFARYRDQVTEDGVPFGQPVLHTETVEPGQDFSKQPAQVKAICEVLHTQEKIDAFRALVEAP